MEILLLLRLNATIHKTSHTMKVVLFLTAFFGLIGQRVLSQTSYPDLPDTDYAVYTTIINEFPNCNDEQRAHLRNQLLFIKPVTVTQSRYGFSFDFAKAQEQLTYLLRPQTTFYKEPDWQKFIASIDTSQFAKYALTKTIRPQCQKITTWTDQQEEYYFGKETAKYRGYYALRNDYKDFGGIVSFSKVAYSANHQKALCYYSEVSDGRAGAGYLIFLEKSDGIWDVVGKATLWVS